MKTSETVARRLLGAWFSVLLLLFAGCESTPQEKLQKAGYDFNAEGLNLALAKGDEQSFNLFVEAQFDFNSKDKAGFTPLLRALDLRDSRWFFALLKHGADSNSKTPTGQSALILAIQKNNLLQYLRMCLI